MKKLCLFVMAVLCIRSAANAQYLIERKTLSQTKYFESTLPADVQPLKQVHVAPSFFAGANPDDN